jgi:hypothetical protein
MTYQFTYEDDEVTIQTEWNTRTIYINKRGHENNPRTWIALTKYNLYQHTAWLREAQYKAAAAAQTVKYAPLAFWLNVSRPVRLWAYRRVASVRHYMLLTRTIRSVQ